MEWLALLSIAAVLGSISCVENYDNFGNRWQQENFNPFFNKFSNFESIKQPSGHWHYNNNGNRHNVQVDSTEEESSGFGEDERRQFSGVYSGVYSNHFDNADDEEQPQAEQDFGVSELQSEAQGTDGLLTLLPALKDQLEYLSNGSVSNQKQVTRNHQTNNNHQIVDPVYNFNDSIDTKTNSGILDIKSDDNYSETEGRTEYISSSFFGELLRSAISNAILSNGLDKEVSDRSVVDDSHQTRDQAELTGDIPSLLVGSLRSEIPNSGLSSELGKGLSKISSIRNSLLDFRDKALDHRVGTAQQNELNQFDPIFQASLSKSNHGSAADDQITWNKLRNLVSKFQTSSPQVQENEKIVHPVKNSFLGLLRNDKGSVLSSSNKQEGDSDSSRGSKFKFLSSAKNFVTNPVGFVERKIRNKIKQKIKDEIKQSVGDITNRVVQFKSNMTGLAGELKESFDPKSSGKTNRNCLKIITGLHANQLYLNGKQIPDAWILYVDKSYPKDFHSCAVNHQDEVLKDCLVKGSILLLSQPDKVKVEEEHGRELELIIAKDVVKDRINGIVDMFFQNYGKQFMKGFHIFKDKTA